MSLKAELETWATALKAYDEEDFEKALDYFNRIADSAKILTNIGLIYATIGEHEAAVENFNAATSLDQYLAVAYFQCGVSNFLLTRYDLSSKDFEEALLYLRGNQSINYEQLGLKFKLYSAEVLFNLGLSKIYLGQLNEGMKDMDEARREKATDEHGVIDDAIQDQGEGYTVFSIPVGVLYRPSANKLKNVGTRDYLGKAKLVAASDERDAYTTFTGVTRLQQGMTPSGAPLDRPASDPSSDRPEIRPPIPPPRDEPPLSRKPTTITVSSRSDDDRLVRSKSAAESRPGGSTRNLSVRTPVTTSGSPNYRSPTSRSAGGRISPAAGFGGRMSPAAGLGGRNSPAPGFSGKRDEQDAQSPDGPGKAQNASRLTEIYDDYIDAYAEEVPDVPPLPAQLVDKNRIAAWARNNANPSTRRPGDPSTYGAQYASSSYGGGSFRRKLSRRPTYGARTAPGARSTMYDEEEEGYASGDYDEAPFELVKIRVKLHYKEDVRGMALTPDMSFDEFIERVTQKFKRPFDGLQIKFKDEDGTKVSLRDDSDYELAIETARENARGKPEGKLEVWCMDQ